MGLSRVVAAIALIPAAFGWALQSHVPLLVPLVLYHVAGTGFVVAAAATDPLANKTRGLLGKKRDGGMRAVLLIVLWPFHLGLRLRFRMRKSISSEPLYHEIIPGWFVGGWPANQRSLPPGDPSVLDCTCEFPKGHDSNRYLCLLVWDTHGATASQIKEGVDWAVAQNQKEHPIYIHCAHGHGRSVALLIACLIKIGHCRSIQDGEVFVKTIRPKIRLNTRQRREVRRWMEMENISE